MPDQADRTRALNYCTEAYRKACKDGAKFEQRAHEMARLQDQLAARMVELCDGDHREAGRQLGVSKMRVGNHVADANGVLRGMAPRPEDDDV